MSVHHPLIEYWRRTIDALPEAEQVPMMRHLLERYPKGFQIDYNRRPHWITRAQVRDYLREKVK